MPKMQICFAVPQKIECQTPNKIWLTDMPNSKQNCRFYCQILPIKNASFVKFAIEKCHLAALKYPCTGRASSDGQQDNFEWAGPSVKNDRKNPLPFSWFLKIVLLSTIIVSIIINSNTVGTHDKRTHFSLTEEGAITEFSVLKRLSHGAHFSIELYDTHYRLVHLFIYIPNGTYFEAFLSLQSTIFMYKI